MNIPAEQLTDEQLLRRLVEAGYSRTTACAAIDVFRQVCQAVSTGTKAEPRSGWSGRA